MRSRHALSTLILAGLAGLIGCGKSETPSNTPSGDAVQMNISGPPPIVLGPDNIQGEIDKAGSGVKLARLDLSSAGLPLLMDAPEGAKVVKDTHAALLSDSVDVQVTAGENFALRIRLGKRPFDQKRTQLGEQKVIVNTKDMVLSESMILLDARWEFARHVVAGLQDYCIENVAPLLGKQVNHSQADCLLMLKCAATLEPKTPPPAEPLAALQTYNAAIVKNAAGQAANMALDPRQTSDATLALLAKVSGLERLTLRRCPITDEGLAHLAGLATLKELNLADCPITDAGLSALSDLTNLEILNLASSFGDSPRIKGDGLTALARLQKLQVLVLDKNLIDDAGLSALKDLKGLRELYLEQTRVTGPGLANLRGLGNLTLLSLNETKLTDAGLEGLRDVTSLEVLNLRGTQVQGEGIKQLHGLKSLHTLHRSNTPLGDAGLTSLAGLPNLQHLILEETQVSDAGLDSLQKLKGLKRLSLARSKVTAAGADKLKAALPGVAITMK